jgi:hypothetical protein
MEKSFVVFKRGNAGREAHRQKPRKPRDLARVDHFSSIQFRDHVACLRETTIPHSEQTLDQRVDKHSPKVSNT